VFWHFYQFMTSVQQMKIAVEAFGRTTFLGQTSRGETLMKKVLIGVLFLFAWCAYAQDVPRFETYLGYNFTRVNSGINVHAFSANGGLGEIALNFNKWLAVVGSFPSVHNGNISDFHVDQTSFGYMLGPRLNVHFGRVTPFVEGLAGGTHVSRSFKVPGTAGQIGQTTFAQRFVNDSNEFSFLAGGGLDLAFNKHLAFRPIKLDYYQTRFQPLFIQGLGNPNRNRNQNNLLYSTGFNFRF
jgi:opacity protein-like surface antigen